MDKLTIAYIQPDIIWEDSNSNLRKLDKVFNTVKQVDLIVLPEMFNTGFTMNADKVAQIPNSTSTLWLKKHAIERGCAVMGSTIIQENSAYFNRLLMATHDANVQHYDKRHLFRMGQEHKQFSAGTKRVTFDYEEWKIRPQICYDLRFPVWSRNENNYDMLVYVANWPGSRREVWKTLLIARAIENSAYVIGVNRIGNDGMDINYTGDSMVINPKGEIISELPENTEGVGYAELSLKELHNFREKFPVHIDADRFSLDV